MKDKDLLKDLLKNGWVLVRVHGSHHIVEKNGKIETIPIHGKDVPKGLLNAILKRTGLKQAFPLDLLDLGGIYEIDLSRCISCRGRKYMG